MSAELRLENISLTFGVGTVDEKQALDGFSLCVPAGQFVTVLGANGAGKSTLFNVITGKARPQQGRVLLNGRDISGERDYQRARQIGYLLQDPRQGTAPNLTIEENLALAYGRQAERSLLALNRRQAAFFREHLSQLGLGLEDRLHSKMGLLSGGQRQAATLLMATIARPQLLLLDEHTAALDPATAEKVLALTEKLVREQQLTTLMITHDLGQALRLGDRTIMLDQGRLVLDISGPQRKSMTVPQLIQLYSNAARVQLSDRSLLSGSGY